ncbi:uncharacterized mitochondrial protein AtMg00820-like [Nicotiana sylvestris]|uniref:uncharacterized mitochondrial protein AtMg00820-like n=1 Tax=Nicotiana sylvestris TaxID=4096 RepID=UPI00388CA418
MASLAAYSVIVEPSTFKEASVDPKWVEAMQAEISALQDNNTWSLVKYKSNGEVERYKARLVVKDYSQQEGLDYIETFSLVAKMVTVRAMVALAAASGWYIFQMDIHNAFLQRRSICKFLMAFQARGDSKGL